MAWPSRVLRVSGARRLAFDLVWYPAPDTRKSFAEAVLGKAVAQSSAALVSTRGQCKMFARDRQAHRRPARRNRSELGRPRILAGRESNFAKAVLCHYHDLCNIEILYYIYI